MEGRSCRAERAWKSSGCSDPVIALEPTSAFLFHDRHRVSFCVTEGAEPKVVVGHLGNEVRLIDERDAARLEIAMDPLDVTDEEVEDRAGMVVLLLLRGGEHEPRAAGIEKGERWAGGEQKGNA